ncbi:MAG: carboxypeptidase regulatory-like domain-containing protein, partial [Acidobacteriota bacterium]
MRCRWHAFLLLLFALGTVPAAAELTVRGRVVDEAGQALSEARVELHPLLDAYTFGQRLLAGGVDTKPVDRVETDRSGEFELAAPGIGLWRIEVTLAGRVSMARWLDPLLHPLILAEVRLMPAEAVAVTVTDGAAPVARALVDFGGLGGFGAWRQAWETGQWQPARRWAWTDAAGQAVLPRAVGEVPEIRANHADYRLATATASESAVTVALEPSAQRLLRVKDSRGRPAAGILFRAGRFPVGLTDATGEVRLPSAVVELEPSTLVIDGGEGYQVDLGKLPADQDVLRLPPADEVAGTVVERDSGRVIPEALVWRDRAVPAAVRTDGRGGFRWRTTEKTLRLGFAADGYSTERQTVDTEAETAADLAIVLHPAGAIAGRVIDEERRPVAGARVELRPIRVQYRSWNTDNESNARTVTSVRGRFRFDELPRGELQAIRAYHEGYAPAAITAEPTAGRGAAVEIVLERGALVFGEVVDESLQPVVGASVQLSHEPEADEARLEIPQGEFLIAPETTTDADGRFEVWGVPVGRHTARVKRQGFAQRSVRGVRVSDGGAEVDLGTITLADAAAIEVRVTDREGEPIARVSVRARPTIELSVAGTSTTRVQDVVGETDREGLYRSEDLTAGDRVDLFLGHAAFVDEVLRGIAAPTEEPIEIVLRAGAAVSGRVVTETGEVVAGAHLVATTRITTESRWGSDVVERHQTASAAEDGRFELLGIHPGDVRLTAKASGFAEATLRLQLDEGDRLEDLTLELRQGARVTGRVLDYRGAPVVGARVTVGRQESENEWSGTSTTTDGDGRFRLGDRPLGPSEVSARHPGFGTTSVEIVLSSGDNPVDLVLASSLQVAGRVVDTAGKPIPRARLQLEWRSGSSATTTSRQTEADGLFAFELEGPGDYAISAKKEGLAEVTRQLTVGRESIRGLELVLHDGAAIAGTVLGLSPEERGRVIIRASSRSTDDGSQTTTIDADGRFRVTGLTPGRWRLTATLPGSGREARAIVEIQPGEAEVVYDLALAAGELTLSGEILVDGEPAAGATVWLDGPSAADTLLRIGSDGRFRFDSMAPGVYTVSIDGDWGSVREVVELWS